MKPRKLETAISFALSTRTRAIITRLAEEENISLGEAARALINEGIKVRGIEC